MFAHTKAACPCVRETVDVCRKAVGAGASWITVHGRTPRQRCQPVNVDAIRTVAQSLQVPVVANGDVTSVAIAASVRRQTGVTGAQLCLPRPGRGGLYVLLLFLMF